MEEGIPIIDYAVISFAAGDEDESEGSDEAGRREKAYRDLGDWTWQEPREGTVLISKGAVRADGLRHVTAQFWFDVSGDQVTVDGDATESENLLAGDGLRMKNGTGRFAGKSNPVRLEQRNPKRWSVE